MVTGSGPAQEPRHSGEALEIFILAWLESPYWSVVSGLSSPREISLYLLPVILD